jgi:hypothetical protein
MADTEQITGRGIRVEVKKWQDRISVSKRWRDRMAEDEGWERFIKQYNEGDYDVTLGSRKGRMKVPKSFDAFAYVQADIAGMASRDPYIAVNPKKKGTVQGAAFLEAGVNYWWRELQIKQEMEYTLTDSDVIGHGWMKDGYITQTSGDGDALRVSSETMFVEYVSWRDIVFNVGTRRLGKDTLWMAHRIVKPLDELKEKYPSLGKLEGSFHPHLKESDYADSMNRDDIKVGILWEVWDKSTRTIYLIAEGFERWVVKPRPWPEYVENFPLTPLWWYPKLDRPYPISPLAIQEDQSKEEVKILTQALNHIKRFNRQVLLKAGVLSEEDKDRFEEGQDGAILDAQIATGNLQDATKVVDFGSLPPDIYLILDRLAQKKREFNGQPEFERGGTTKTQTRTLGELESIEAGAKGRQNKRIDRLEDFMETIARHMIAHMKANFDVEQMAKIVDGTPEEIIQAFGNNYNPVTKMVTFTKEDIQGEYDVDVKAGSTLPLNKTTRMAILKDVLNIAVQIDGPVPPFAQVVISELLHEFEMPQLSEAFDEEQQTADQEAQAEQKSQGMEDAKTAAEAEKRKAQADQIDAETAILEKHLTLPPELHPMSAEDQAEPAAV